jgi:protein-tyrosine phosphatase
MTTHPANLNMKEQMNFDVLNRGQFTDIHCHCLPGIDDGPETITESLALCQALVRDRITTVIATPHQLGRFNRENNAAKIREKVRTLNKELKNNNIALSVAAGADVKVDERICQLIKDDEVLSLADGRKYILLEPPDSIYIDIEPLLIELLSIGIKAIITHPERHPVLALKPQLMTKWIENKAGIQITAGSLQGRFGPIAKKNAWQLLSSGAPLLVATDSHNTGSRCPCMRAAFELIRAKLGDNIAHLVCIENPSRVLEGKDILTVPYYKSIGGKHGQIQDIGRFSTISNR